MSARLAADFERFGRELPRDFPAYVRDAYGIDLATTYLGHPIPHPIGKGSGQLSLRADQLETDRAAGLAFSVLKTVIGETESGERSMSAWAIHESRMRVENRRSADGRVGWTVTWKGRGWDRSFAEYLELVRVAGDLSRATDGMLAVPSAKLHLPTYDEPFRTDEYRHTVASLATAYGGALSLEHDFSPTLAGDRLADERSRILRWLEELGPTVRAAAGSQPVRLALKLMNARFDDAFQLRMMASARDADTLVVFNRLWDPEISAAYGGWDLSERNLRVLDAARELGPLPELSGTGNVCSGRTVVEYARRGCASVQLHTFFQLPLSEYPAAAGTRTQRALHALVFHPAEGLIAAMLELEQTGAVARRDGVLHFSDLVRASVW